MRCRCALRVSVVVSTHQPDNDGLRVCHLQDSGGGAAGDAGSAHQGAQAASGGKGPVSTQLHGER